MGPVIVTDMPRRKKKPHSSATKQAAKTIDTPDKQPNNLFSDETVRRLLRWLKGKKNMPTTLPGLRPDRIKSKGPDQAAQRDIQEELAEAIRERLIPWLWSFSVHALLLIALALMFLPAMRQQGDLIITLQIGDFKELNPDNGQGPETGITIITPPDKPQVEDPIPQTQQRTPVETSNEKIPDDMETGEATVISYQGREPGSRPNQPGGGGGNGETDEAVLAGLRWLIKNQTRDGSWHLCGPYKDTAPRDQENKIAATGMALLAFQGYGATPVSSHPELIKFSKPVRDAWTWLRTRQDEKTGCFFRDDMPSSHRFYTHGICTIAICELYAMTKDESLRAPSQAAIDYCLKHQNVREGGWRYRPDRWHEQSDVSVTGWILMALKSGQAARLEIPKENLDRISKYLDTMARDDGSQYVYREDEPEIRLSMTAEAMLCRELLGWKRNDPRLIRGIHLIADPEYLPRFDSNYHRDAYRWYYATQALFHYGGDPWIRWNLRMREELPKHQETTGREAGSWDPQRPVRDEWGQRYGRLYTTCLSLYMLEVYYRHLGVYRH